MEILRLMVDIAGFCLASLSFGHEDSNEWITDRQNPDGNLK
jgi:hypothetical protein